MSAHRFARGDRHDAAGPPLGLASGRRSTSRARSSRPRIIPAHRNASHGNSGWVPLTNTLNSRPRGELVGGLVSHARRLAVGAALEDPPVDPGAGDGGRHADGDEPRCRQREQEGGDDEHRPVVGQDRARPDLVEDQPEAVEHEAAADQRPPLGGDGRPGCRAGRRSPAGEQRHADAGGEHERGGEAGRQRPLPRVEEAAPEVAATARRPG